jgi:hypothetical protein
VRYTLPGGEQRLVNICRPGGRYELIETYKDPADYLLGVDGHGGLMGRDIVTIRVEDWDPHAIMAMHHYYATVQNQCRSAATTTVFDMFCWRARGWVDTCLGRQQRLAGSCAGMYVCTLSSCGACLPLIYHGWM